MIRCFMIKNNKHQEKNCNNSNGFCLEIIALFQRFAILSYSETTTDKKRGGEPDQIQGHDIQRLLFPRHKRQSSCPEEDHGQKQSDCCRDAGTVYKPPDQCGWSGRTGGLPVQIHVST